MQSVIHATGSLTQSLTLKINEVMSEVNPKHEEPNNDPRDEEEKRLDDESDRKLNNIEIELEDIAQGVRNNLQ